jgi:membrane dipeptidase
MLVFDGHNDVLSRLHQESGGNGEFLHGGDGHLDLPDARAGGFAGGLFAVFPCSPFRGADDPFAVDYARAVGQAEALADTLPMFERLAALERESGEAVRTVRDAADLDACLDDGSVAAVLHLEGAEAIDPGLDALEVFYRAGLRSIGPVWSRPNAFAHGVPFKFPHSPDTGPGLTDAGRELVRACNRLGIMLDLSHMNERGFWDVAELSDAPLVATHSNAHALCPVTRNLTDKQLDAIRESGGLVGVNFHVGFLRPDGKSDPDTPLAVIADHVDYLVARLGPDKVGFGSDFDGATMPAALGDAAGLPRLLDTLRGRGYDEPTLRQIAHGNWLRVLERTWGE